MKHALFALSLITVLPVLGFAQNSDTPNEPVVRFTQSAPRLSNLAKSILDEQAYLMMLDPDLLISLFDDTKPEGERYGVAYSAKAYLITRHNISINRIFTNYDLGSNDGVIVIRFNEAADSASKVKSAVTRTKKSAKVSDKWLAKFQAALDASEGTGLTCKTIKPIGALKYGRSTSHEISLIPSEFRAENSNLPVFESEHDVLETPANDRIIFLRKYIEAQAVSRKRIAIPFIQRSKNTESLELNLASIDLKTRTVKGEFTRKSFGKSQASVLCKF